MATRPLDIQGKIFNNLKVLGSIPGRKNGQIIWECECLLCGNHTFLRGCRIKSGETKSCGCLIRPKDIKGYRFGRLVVIESYGSDIYGTALWRCICNCGTEIIVRGSSLRSGKTRSCGCLQKYINKNRLTKHGLSKTKEYAAWMARNRKEKDSNWTWLMEISLKAMFPICVNCGSKLKLAIDHVYPLDKGYGLIPGNAVRLCKRCNSSKRDKLPDQLPIEFRDRVIGSAEKFRIAWSGGF